MSWKLGAGSCELEADCYELARFASVLTASTIAINPMPLPIEMLRRKMRSTMSQSTFAISAAGSPESDLSRIVASARAEMPGRILDREVQLQRAVRLLQSPDVGIGLALRDVILLRKWPCGDLRRDLLEDDPRNSGACPSDRRDRGTRRRFPRGSSVFRGAFISLQSAVISRQSQSVSRVISLQSQSKSSVAARQESD